jgi:hypothetical protein
MFGMLLAMLYEDAMGMRPVALTARPSVNASAQVLTNPVTRETIVAIDIDAVERATDGASSGSTSGTIASVTGSVSSLMVGSSVLYGLVGRAARAPQRF